MESAKLVKATGEPLRALQELENSMQLLGLIEEVSDVIDLTDDDESKATKAKVRMPCFRALVISEMWCRPKFLGLVG